VGGSEKSRLMGGSEKSRLKGGPEKNRLLNSERDSERVNVIANVLILQS